MTDLIQNYGFPTAVACAAGGFCVVLITFLKNLLLSELSQLKSNQQKLARECRSIADDIARIELMLRLTHDISKHGRVQPEMARIGKAGTDVDLDDL